jgi:hypothetical protein
VAAAFSFPKAVDDGGDNLGCLLAGKEKHGTKD